MNAHPSSLLTDIGLGIIFAAAASHVARVLRQPLLIGYVLGGVLLGSQLGFGLVTDEASIELISEMGLILLLFIIGLEIDLRQLIGMGRSMFVLGLAQFLGCVALALGFFRLLGFTMGGGNFDLLYLAVALALSSTLIVVKLLHDKFETSTVAGGLTIGILVLQDVFAIAFMAFQPNLQDPHVGAVLRSFLQGGVLIAFAFLASRYVLARLFHAAGRFPELVLLSSTAWCFLICGLAEHAGLSKEMGALIAGMSIAAFPYGTDVISKLAGVRDFFVTLFFVSLGLKVPQPSWSVLGMSGVLVVFVIASRALTVVPAARMLKLGLRTGFVTSVNLSQISEFSLVILALGAGYKHVSDDLRALVLTAMLLASVVSTYLTLYSDTVARLGLRLAGRLGFRDSDRTQDRPAHASGRDIVVLGCFREGAAFLDALHRESPELAKRILVVDFNPAVRAELEKKGYRWVYGDLSHAETLRHLGIEEAAVIISPVSDMFLKGTDNLRLLGHLRRLAPKASVVVTAEDAARAQGLREAGASVAVVPSDLAGARFVSVVRDLIGERV